MQKEPDRLSYTWDDRFQRREPERRAPLPGRPAWRAVPDPRRGAPLRQGVVREGGCHDPTNEPLHPIFGRRPDGTEDFSRPNVLWEFNRVSGARDGDVRFLYFGEHQPRAWAVGLPKQDGDWQIDLIDTWDMTVTPLDKAPLPTSPASRQRGGAITGHEPEAAFGVRLPGKPFQAVRIRPR